MTTTPATGTTPVTTPYTLDANCKAYYQSAEVALTTLALTDTVQLSLTQNVVTTITVTQEAVTT